MVALADDQVRIVRLHDGYALLYDRDDYDAWIMSQATIDLDAVV